MAKYRVTIQPSIISKPEVVRNVIALDASNAKEIALMRNKGSSITGCVRQGVGTSTYIQLDDIKSQMVSAMDAGDNVEAKRHEKTFYSTVASLKSHMDVVAWGMTSTKIPYLPPIN